MIKGFVQGQTLKLSQTKVVAGSIDYLIAKFTFNDAEWASLDKWMHLQKGESVYAVRLQNDRTRKEDHLNLDAGEWSVWLHGNSQEDGVVTERITTNVCTFTVEDSGVLSGDALPELPAGIGEQVMARMEALEAQMEQTDPLPDPSELENGRVLMIVNGKWQAADVPSGGANIMVDAELSETSENPVQNKVITQTMNALADDVEQALANVSSTVPAFDLAALGLPPLAEDGSGVVLETDTTEIMTALEKGPVKFIVAADNGDSTSTNFELVVNSVFVDGMFVCSQTVDFTGSNPLMFTIMVTENAVGACITDLFKSESSSYEIPTFDLVAMGLPTVEVNGMQSLQADATEIMAALEKGTVKFILSLNIGVTVDVCVVTSSISAAGSYLCTSIPLFDDLYLLKFLIEDGLVQAALVSFGGRQLPPVSASDDGKLLQVVDGEWQAAYAQNVPASIDMSAFDSEGKIVETFEDGTSKTSVIEFDEGGNPVKITDGDGNVTVLTW